LTENEVIELKKDIQKITLLRGNNIKLLQPIELDNNHEKSFRRGVYPKRSIGKGEIIKGEDLVFLRPNEGTHSMDSELVIGSRALRKINALQPIQINVDYEVIHD
jgi:sialic acid synthase SpsE